MAAYGYGRLEHAGHKAKAELAYVREKWREQPKTELLESAAAASLGAAAGLVRGRYGVGALSIGKSAQKDANGNKILDAKGNEVSDPYSGVPIALLGAVLLHGASYTSAATGVRTEYRAAGDVFLTVAGMQIGERVGMKMKEKADKAAAAAAGTTTTAAGMAGMAGGYATRELAEGAAHLTPEERHALWIARSVQGR